MTRSAQIALFALGSIFAIATLILLSPLLAVMLMFRGRRGTS